MTLDGIFSDQRLAEFDLKGIYYQEAHIHLLSCGTRVQHVNGLAVTSVASPSFSLLHGKQEAGRKCVLYGDSGFPRPSRWNDWVVFRAMRDQILFYFTAVYTSTVSESFIIIIILQT